jgi:hypothetical protein
MSNRPHRPRGPRSGLLGVVGVAMALTASVLGSPVASASVPVGSGTAHPSYAARGHAKVIKVKVNRHLFGVHDYNWNSLHRPGTGAIRLWDSGTQWRDLFPNPATPNWSRLDAAVAQAHADGTEVTLVLGLTPAWAAPDPANPLYPTMMPDPTLYKNYVAAVMSRYSPANLGYRGIAAYQVWNEANITTFWNGTYDQLGQLVKGVYDVRNAVDPGAKIIAPAMVTRLKYQQAGVRKFYATKVQGVPVWKYVDAISLNLYPLDSYSGRPGTPEDSMSLLNGVRAILAKDKVPARLPIWNTEVNYGMKTGPLGGHSAVPISSDLQVAYLMRTYILNAAEGVKRVDWYAYDMGDLSADVGGQPLGNTLLTDPSNRAAGTLTPAGVAFTRVQKWIRGTLVGTSTKRPCATDSHGTYTCVVKYARGIGRIYWNPYRSARVRLVPSATKRVNEYGSATRARGGQRMKVSYQPVLVRSRR